MLQAVFEFVAAAADEALGSGKIEGIAGFNEITGFLGPMAAQENLSGQNRASGLFAGGAESLLDEGLIKAKARHWGEWLVVGGR
jgi:hypothetical protein